jgi:predicted  nucleic acid-binding Zn-ribbon protein
MPEEEKSQEEVKADAAATKAKDLENIEKQKKQIRSRISALADQIKNIESGSPNVNDRDRQRELAVSLHQHVQCMMNLEKAEQTLVATLSRIYVE